MPLAKNASRLPHGQTLGDWLRGLAEQADRAHLYVRSTRNTPRADGSTDVELSFSTVEPVQPLAELMPTPRKLGRIG